MVRVLDPETDEVLDEATIENDYVLICAGTAQLTHTQVSGGTHTLTVKGSRRGAFGGGS